MELSSLLCDLHLSSSLSEKPRPLLPPITELLSRLQEKLIGAADKPSEISSLIGQVERLVQAAESDWLFSSDSAAQEGGWEELRAAYVSLISALIGCAALPLCEDDCSSPTTAAYQNIPNRAAAVSSALTVLLRKCEEGGATRLLHAVAPPICVFAVTHFQVSHHALKQSVLMLAVLTSGSVCVPGSGLDLLLFQSGCTPPAGGAADGGTLDKLRPPLDG